MQRHQTQMHKPRATVATRLHFPALERLQEGTLHTGLGASFIIACEWRTTRNASKTKSCGNNGRTLVLRPFLGLLLLGRLLAGTEESLEVGLHGTHTTQRRASITQCTHLQTCFPADSGNDCMESNFASSM